MFRLSDSLISMFLSEDFEAILSIFGSGDVSYKIGKVISHTSSGIVAWF